MTATITDTSEAKLREILSDLDAAASGIVAASKKYAEACDADPTFAGFCRDNAPWVREQTWQALLSVGRDEADWRVAMGIAPHAGLLARLPVKTQTNVLDNGIDVPTGDGDVVRMQVCNMSASQAKRALAGGALRTPTEMAASARTVKRSAVAPRRWSIRNGVLRVYEPCIITRDEIVAILQAISQ